MRNVFFTAVAASIPLVRAHIAFWDPSMWGYGVHMETFPYDNRPVAPLMNYTFDKWWFHGHLAYPPAPNTFFELPAGGNALSQLACNRGATEWWQGSEGSTDIRQGNYPCPGYPTSQFHGPDDLKGCALSIAYNSDVNSIQPEDLAIFSVNHTCVWSVNTTFSIPQDMPPCPDGGCICAWHWIHSVDSGSAQMFMNGFRCKVTGSTSSNPIMKPQVPKRCTNNPSACYTGAQQPMYWWQNERNNMPNTQYDPPYYLDEWGFFDGAQNGIFEKGDGNASTPPANNTPTSTPAYQPSSTPAVGNEPSSTPVDNKSTPTLTPTSGNSGDLPKSSPSSPPVNNVIADPSPSPTNNANDPHSSSLQGDGKNNTGTNTANNHSPAPSKKPRCKNKKDKKRRRVAARRSKLRRHHAREHNH